MIKQLINFLKISRWKNVLIYIILQVLLYFILFEKHFKIDDGWFFLVLTMVSFGIFGNIQNNLVDYKLDQLKEDFLEFNKNIYLIWSIIFGILGGTFGFIAFYFTNKSELLFIILLMLAIIILYNYFLKKWPLIGNILIAITTAMAIYIPIFFAKDLDGSNPYYRFLIIMAFWLSLLRELAKDLEDAYIDKQFDYKTLPVINETFSKFLMLVMSLIIWTIMLSYKHYFPSFSFYILLIISSLLLILSLLKIYQNKYETATKFLKLLMLTGIFSIFFI